MDIAKWVKEARAHGGLTMAKLGEAVGRTKANVSGWENGRHEPSISQIDMISKLTGYPPPWVTDESWPLTHEMLAALRRADSARIRQAENAARNVLELDPLPRLGNEMAARVPPRESTG